MKCTKALLILLTTVCAFSACKKDPAQPMPTPPPPSNPPPVTPPPPAPAQLTITSFTPTSGAKDQTITIIGTGFSTTTTNNTVTINGMAASVLTATAEQLTIKVPVHAGTGALQVQVGSQTAGATPVFQYLYTVSTIAGDGTPGYKDGPGAQAEFNNAFGITVDAAGNLYVADSYGNRIRKITPDHTVSTLAGDGTKSFKEGNGTNAEFNTPYGIAATANGTLYVADIGNNRIRKITPAGDVSTLAGDGIQGFKNGAGDQAEFKTPEGVALDATGNIYVADTYNGSVRKITPAGDVSTLAGNGTLGDQEGTGDAVRMGAIFGIFVDGAGFVYTADQDYNKIRKISPVGAMITLAGVGPQGFQDGPGSQAKFTTPTGVADGGHGYVYVADYLNFRIRQITPTGLVITIAGSSTEGFKDGVGGDAQFSNPTAITVDAQGTIYVMDAGNYRVRKIE